MVTQTEEPRPQQIEAAMEEAATEDGALDKSAEQANAAPKSPRSPATPFTLRETKPMSLAWHNLVFEVEIGGGLCGKPAEAKQIVKGTSGHCKPGSLTALMGPSGAGKSTMLNVLAGRAPYGKIASGDVILNGQKADPELYRQQLAYVMQQDAMFATQTPREALRFTARLRLPEYSEEQREEICEQAIEALRLKSCADTPIGSELSPGLSGGEKKRAAVAVELISSPSLIFLDEPTSGLDSHSAFELIQILRQLAEAGCTIICTIHQPSSEVFALFHNVIFLRYGQITYNGPVSGITDHFNTEKLSCSDNTNPSDFAMQVLQMIDDEEAQQFVNKVPQPEIPEITGTLQASDVPPVITAGVGAQLIELMKREVNNLIRDKQILGARFGMSVILSFMVGAIFWGVGDKWGEGEADIAVKISNHWGALIFYMMIGMFLAAQPMVLAFPLERPSFIREYTVGTYSAPAYMLAKSAVDIPAAFIQQLLSLVVLYFMCDMNGNFLFWLLGSSLFAVTSASTALVIGAATRSPEAAVNLLPSIFVPQILFSGAFIATERVPEWLRWLQYVCPLKYATNIVTSVEFESSQVPDNRTQQVQDFVDRINVDADLWWLDVTILLTLLVSFRVIATIVLASRAKKFE